MSGLGHDWVEIGRRARPEGGAISILERCARCKRERIRENDTFPALCVEAVDLTQLARETATRSGLTALQLVELFEMVDQAAYVRGYANATSDMDSLRKRVLYLQHKLAGR